MRISEIISSGIKLYHGSQQAFPVGFVLRPQSDGYATEPETQNVERIIETYRPKNKLSRTSSVFMVDNPELIDYAGGYEDYVYLVQPIGRVEKSDLAWYSEVQNTIDYDDPNSITPEAIQAAQYYWSGVPFKNSANSLFEYRAKAARIISLFSQLNERVVDPARLAQRVASRYGRRTKYGHWEAPIKGQHIPMRSFRSREADAVYRAYVDKRNSLSQYVRPDLPPRERDQAVTAEFMKLFRPETMDIRVLRATQPFVRVDDPNMLAAKLGETSPRIRVATYRGQNYIMDGHHAVAAAAMRGDRQLMVSRIDLDTPL